MNLVNYDGWVQKYNPFCKGRHRNEQGLGLSGFYRRDYRKSSEMLILQNGWLMIKYKYPRIEIPFKSPMHNWRNILYCGGFSLNDENGEPLWTREKLFKAIASRKKPVGFIVIEKKDEAFYLENARLNGLIYKKQKPDMMGKMEIGFANSGTFNDHFSLTDLIDSYLIMADASSLELFIELKKILSLKNKKLSFFLDGYDYANPKTEYELILTGLILGYPIESTFSILS